MQRMRRRARFIAIILFSAVLSQPSQSQSAATAVLWSDPGNIGSKNLFWGAGGEERQPKLPVEFEKEERGGTSPKFEVRDAAGKKWGVKMGLEPRPETAASRLMWAVGYLANETYFYPLLPVANMPATLRRGQQYLTPRGEVLNVRLQRHPEHLKRVGKWNWRKNPFYGTREFNGLRVMMALIGNWDLKDDNNAIFESEKPGPQIYAVSDIGTSMGTPGKSYTDPMSKGNLAVYRRTKLIAHVHKDHIDLNFPKCPPFVELFEFEWGFYFHQIGLRWIGKHIPRDDAKWIGSLLGKLSEDQIRDAFHAAGYSELETNAYTQAVRSRIHELNSL
ncbi:MAG TPA: hypothetical protein VN708_12100 [Terriglobales bacterium]|nr:hypothetical protein [Terriglobales bacterium]